MVVLDQGLEPLVEHVGVNLGCRYIGVAEHLLQRPEVGAVVQQVGGEGMAQDVGRDLVAGDPGLDRQVFQELPDPLPGQVACLGAGGEKPGRIRLLRQELLAQRQVGADRVLRRSPRGTMRSRPPLPRTKMTRGSRRTAASVPAPVASAGKLSW